MHSNFRERISNRFTHLQWDKVVWLTVWLLITLVTISLGAADPAGGGLPPVP